MAKGLMHLKFNEQSVRKLFSNLNGINLATKAGAKKVLRQTALNIMAQSQSEVPRETETLASTAFIEQPKESGKVISIILGYGGINDKRNPIPDKNGNYKMASDYARDVHETPEYYHPYGKWKFLEDPVRAHQAEFGQMFKAELSAIYSMWSPRS
jgi:hypothetical protein